MGSGASSQVQEGVQGQSVENLAAALKEISPENYQKLADAMVILEGGSAPFLKKAFGLINECFVLMSAAEITGEWPDESVLEQLEADYKDNIGKSFKHHDKDASGKLDKDQAKLFFSHLLEEGAGFMDAMCQGVQKMILSGIKAGLVERMTTDKFNKDDISTLMPGALKACASEVDKVKGAILENIAKMKSAYAASKAEKDAEAMKIADTDGSGNLDLAEFMAMMDFGEPLNLKLMESMGIVVDPEEFTNMINMEDLQKQIEDYMGPQLNLLRTKKSMELAATLPLPEDSNDSSAPFLKKAFECLDSMNDQSFAAAKADGPDPDLSKLELEYRAYLIRSFQHHDKDSSGKLDKEQAGIFFSNLLAEGCPFVDTICTRNSSYVLAETKTQIQAALEEAVGKEQVSKFLPGALKVVEEELKMFEAGVREESNMLKENYRACKAEKDADALKAADTDGNGNLTMDEFVAMMEVGTELNTRLMTCLGLTLQPDALMEKLDSKSNLEQKMEKYMIEQMQKIM